MTQELNSFAIRLQSQLRLRGKTISPTLLAREFNLRWRGAPISTNAARKWLYGPTLPKMEKIEVLAKMLGTSAEWLRWGSSSEVAKIEIALQKVNTQTSFTDQQLSESVLHDWSLLNQANKQLISAMLDFLLRQQNLHRNL